MPRSEDAPSLSIHRVARADRSYILALSRTCFAQLGSYDRIIDRWLDVSGVVARVARVGPDAVGYVIIAPHRWLRILPVRSAELVGIAVEAERREQGVGRSLLEEAEAVVRGWKAPEMRLHTACDNLRAQRFFGAAGFHVVDSARSFYPNGQEALEMVKRYP